LPGDFRAETKSSPEIVQFLLVPIVPLVGFAFVLRQQMMTEQRTIEAELAELVVQTLNLEITPEDIDPAQSLVNDLGLDSLDVLEIALTVSKRYGVKLRSDDENNKQVFSSLSALAQHISQHRIK
jgi:acyl carrier protein